MKHFIKHHPWEIIEEDFNARHNRVSESLFSLGNGRMGQRGNFEEDYSGDTHQGSYVAGVYYPDRTRVGWWKNGYPEYFAKVLNAPSWIGIHFTLGGQALDLAVCKPGEFRRVLDMKTGVLRRTFTAIFPDGKKVKAEATRFCSMADGELGAVRYSLTPLNFSATGVVRLEVDADVVNKDSNYDEKFWQEIHEEANEGEAIVTAQTRKTLFHVTTGMTYELFSDGKPLKGKTMWNARQKYADNIDISFLLTLPLSV